MHAYAMGPDIAFMGVLTMELVLASVPILSKPRDDQVWRCHMQIIEHA